MLFNYSLIQKFLLNIINIAIYKLYFELKSKII